MTGYQKATPCFWRMGFGTRLSVSFQSRNPDLPAALIKKDQEATYLVYMRRALSLLISIIMITISSAPAAPQVIAHRGASHDAPENTRAAFDEAWAQGADGIELDIWITKDGRIVVSHDGTTKRTTGVDLVVKDHTLEELQKLDAGKWKGDRWAGEKIPLLDDVLAEMPADKSIFIEIKCGPEVLPELARVVKDSKIKKDQVRIIAFSFETLVAAKPLLPEVKVLWLVDGKKSKDGSKSYLDLGEIAAKVKIANLDGLDLNLGFALDEEAVQDIKSKGLELAVWTANDQETARRLAAAGLETIATDHPAKLKAWLGE